MPPRLRSPVAVGVAVVPLLAEFPPPHAAVATSVSATNAAAILPVLCVIFDSSICDTRSIPTSQSS
jgi:hypothetical protein